MIKLMRKVMEIFNTEMKEIHNIIGKKLEEGLDGFKFNKNRKRLERKNELKIDSIVWDGKKYHSRKNLILSFTILIRHKIVDELYEKLFDCKFETENLIWFNDNRLYENGDETFDIHTMEELNNVIEKTVKYYKNEGNNYFNQFNKDIDFYKYTCIDKRQDAWAENVSLKRIILCYLVDKTNITEIHKYNIECCKSVPSGTDYYLNKYYNGIKIINEYYGEEIVMI